MPTKNHSKQFFLILFFALSFLFCTHVLAAEPVDDLDIGIWHFDETDNVNAEDFSSYNHDLVWNSNPWGGGKVFPPRASGKFDMGINFTQNEERYGLENFGSIDLSSGITLGAWIKTEVNTDEKVRILWLGNYRDSRVQDPSNFIMLSVQNGQVHLDLKQDKEWEREIVSGKIVNDNEWHFLTVTLDPDTQKMTLYVDGQYQAESSFDLPIPILEMLSIGMREYYFDSGILNNSGVIDDVWLRQEPLNEEKINNIFQSGQAYKFDTLNYDLVAPSVFVNYDFDHINGTVALDSSANHYDIFWGYNMYSPGASPTPRLVPGKFDQGVNFKKDWETYSRKFDPIKNFSQGFSSGIWIKTNEINGLPARIFWTGTEPKGRMDEVAYSDYLAVTEVDGKIKVDLNFYDGYFESGQIMFKRQYSLNSKTFISDDTWHHIAVTLDSRPNVHTMKLYIDGILEDTSFFPGLIPPVDKLALGHREYPACGVQYNFNGTEDDFFIMNSVISDKDVKDIYESNSAFTWPIRKRNPVIIVPGIISSYLNRNEPDLPEMWPSLLKMSVPGEDAYLYDLSLNQYGWPNELNIKPTDIFRSVGGEDVFEGLITELEKVGYKENENLFVFPYDWRLSVRWIAGDSPLLWQKTLKQKIEEIIASTGAEKVDIIAHSMGGLIVKSYMKNYGANKVDNFIDIGTPHFGAPKALKMLMYGDDMGFSVADRSIVNISTMKSISQNMPSVFDLLPSQAYQEIKIFSAQDVNYSSYIADVYDLDRNSIKGNLDYNASQDFMKNVGLNTTLLDEANNLHADIDNFNFDKTYNIIGCSTPTIGKISIINEKNSGGYEYGLKYIDGDGTVPLRSANALNTSQTYYTKGVEHGILPSSKGVKQLIASILTEKLNNFNIDNYQNLGNSSAKCGINGKAISFHCPIDIHIYDEFGNHAGPDSNGEIENNISDVSYDMIGGNKFVFLPAGRSFKVVGQATAVGSFNARIQTIEESEYVAESYYNEISMTASTMIKIDNTEQGFMEYDENGDGLIDKTISPSSVLGADMINDISRPETRINIVGVLGRNSWYTSTTTFNLVSEDNESGAGILKTEYKIDDSNWQEYSDQVYIPEGEHSILYKSTDKVGNIEEQKNLLIKVDINAPLIYDVFPNADIPVLHSELIPLLYNISDNISGVAADTVKALVDDVEIKNNQIDLFNFKIGKHKLEISASDLAGNKITKFEFINIVADYVSTINDIERLYLNGDIVKEKVRNDIVRDIKKVEDEILKYQKKNNKEKEFFKTIYDKCLGSYNKEKCKKIVGTADKFFIHTTAMNDHKIKKLIEKILKDLDQFRKKNWINEFGYVIIKDSINYIKEAL